MSLLAWAAPKVTSEYNFATGDDVANDGKRQTFDQLYPTGHDKLGLADQVGWRNIHHLREGIEITPIKYPISFNYHSWWLASAADDGLYSASGALLARRVLAAQEHARRQEIDLQVTRAITPQLQLAGGYAYIISGAS